jgi:hypothetical protein
VKPTRSPNSTLVTRRATAGVAGAAGASPTPVGVPHAKQKRAPGTSSSPQLEQFGDAWVAPHVKQKRAPSGSDSPQLAHVFTG